MADWLFVSYITPLVPGDEDYAISLVVPVDAPGLRLLPRRPYATLATSVYDYPLSSRFDEVDTTVVFDDVLVPWEHVFIYRNVELVDRAVPRDRPPTCTANFQSLVRFGVKLEFMAGLAPEAGRGRERRGRRRPPRPPSAATSPPAAPPSTRSSRPPSAVPSSARATRAPHPQYIYAGMSLQRRLIVDMYRTVRELAGGAFQNLPSSEASFLAPRPRADTERYYRSTAASARDRVKLLKLIWDFIGTEFGGRQLQYEMFYSAAQPVVNRRMFRSYDWACAKAMVDRLLSEY